MPRRLQTGAAYLPEPEWCQKAAVDAAGRRPPLRLPLREWLPAHHSCESAAAPLHRRENGEGPSSFKKETARGARGSGLSDRLCESSRPSFDDAQDGRLCTESVIV